MSLTFVYCEQCKEHASVYQITLPNFDAETCPKCGTTRNPTVSHYFCSWLCLTEWVKENDVFCRKKVK